MRGTMESIFALVPTRVGEVGQIIVEYVSCHADGVEPIFDSLGVNFVASRGERM